MAEERKGQPIEKWNAEIGTLDKENISAEIATNNVSEKAMSERFVELRESTGMNRKDFAEYLGIPYRTMQEWELGRRTMPNYVFGLIEFKIQTLFGLTSEQIRSKDPNALENPMRGIEDQIEQNDNSLDGIINNLPEPEDRAEKEEQAKESVLKKLKESVKISADDREKPSRSFCPDRELC